MHEMSLVRSLISQVEQLVADHGGGSVREIRVSCGALSGVEPALMASAFELVSAETGVRDCMLCIKEIPLEACCNDCQAYFTPERFHFVCPSCGSRETTVTQGDAVILESIELAPVPSIT